jgi:hypothetical protein
MDPQMAQCKSCKANVIWVKLLPVGRLHPLNPTLAKTGNITMLGERQFVAKVLSKAEKARAVEEGELLYTSHFATCPNAKQHRTAS